jgi:hypothetical protein
MFVDLILLASCLAGATTSVASGVGEMNAYLCEVKPARSNITRSSETWNLTSDYQIIENENPTFTDEQIIAELYERQSINKAYSYGGYGSLTDDEFWTIVLNLWPHQYGTAYNLTERAEAQTVVYYPNYTRYLDDGDAFRHTYWSALLTYEFGANFALKLTTAHESNTAEGLDKSMDLHNNNNGTILLEEWRTKFSSNSTDAWADIGEFIYHCVANGEIYDVVKVDSVDEKLVYTNVGGDNQEKFDLRSLINKINITDYDFEQQYFFYNKSKSIISNGGAVVNTERLRTGYIEEEYIVLSPRRLGAGTAYLEYVFSSPVNSICVDLTKWSNAEMLNEYDSTAWIYSSADGINYYPQLNLLSDITLSNNRLYPNQYRIDFPNGTNRIKFIVTSSAVGDRNKGRICIGNMDVLFQNHNY